jgi:hypothetical protein
MKILKSMDIVLNTEVFKLPVPNRCVYKNNISMVPLLHLHYQLRKDQLKSQMLHWNYQSKFTHPVYTLNTSRFAGNLCKASFQFLL